MTRFLPNRLLERELERQPEHRRAIAAEAAEAQRHAETFARTAGAGWMPRKGASRNTIEVSVDGDEVRLVNTDHAGHLMEWGSRNNPPHAVLRRGVRAAGLRLDEK